MDLDVGMNASPHVENNFKMNPLKSIICKEKQEVNKQPYLCNFLSYQNQLFQQYTLMGSVKV